MRKNNFCIGSQNIQKVIHKEGWKVLGFFHFRGSILSRLESKHIVSFRFGTSLLTFFSIFLHFTYAPTGFSAVLCSAHTEIIHVLDVYISVSCKQNVFKSVYIH